MATDLEKREANAASAAQPDAAKTHYDDEFNKLTSPEHLAKDGTEGDLGGGEKPSLYSGNEGVGKKGLNAMETGAVGAGAIGAANGNLSIKGAGNLIPSAPGKQRFLGSLGARLSKRNAAIGTGAGATIVGLIMFGAVTATGPLQIIHYGQLLAHAHPFQHQQSANASRMSELMRWAKSRDIGETRLTTLGSYFNKRYQADFAAQGIQINTDPITGQMKTVAVDVSKNDKYSSLSDADARAAIAADNGVPLDSVRQISGVNGRPKYAFSVSGMDTKGKRSVIGGLIEDQHAGPLSSFSRFRTLTRYYNANSWLHPLRKISATADAKLSAKLRAAAAAADEKSRLKKLVEKSDSVKSFNESIREKINPGALKAVGSALVIASAVCIGKDVADAVPELNWSNVVEPAILSAGDGLAIGSQVALGQDINAAAVGAVAQNFKNPTDDTTPYNSAGIQRLEGIAVGGILPEAGVVQAFSDENTAASISSALDASGAGLLCNPLSQVVQGVAGVALLFTGVGGVVEKGVQLGASFGVGLLIGQLTQNLTKILAEDPITGIPHQGAVGGNVDALGDLALANSNALATGGVALSPSEVSQLDELYPVNQDFASQSIASRLFNINDYRSVAGHVIDAQDPSPAYNTYNTVASLLTGITRIGSVFSNLGNVLMPRALAASTTNYNLGVVEKGSSAAFLNDPRFKDPYANAEHAAQLFDNDTANGYISRALACFGVTISKDGAGKWDARGTTPVNTTAAPYLSANCGDQNYEWLSVRHFINDTSVMEGYACPKLDDEQSCTNDGFGSDTTANTSGVGTIPTGDTVTLAKQILNSPNIKFQTPEERTAFEPVAVTGKQTACGGPTISPTLLGVILALTSKYSITLGVFADGHHCANSLHPLGEAVDINGVCLLSTNQCTLNNKLSFLPSEMDLITQFYTDAGKTLAAAGGGGLGQYSTTCFGSNLPPKVTGVNYFNDLCDHVHIDVGH